MYHVPTIILTRQMATCKNVAVLLGIVTSGRKVLGFACVYHLDKSIAS